MDSSNSWVKYILETRPSSIIVSGVVTTAFAYGVYRLFKWLNNRLTYVQFDEYFENVENTVSFMHTYMYRPMHGSISFLVDQYCFKISTHFFKYVDLQGRDHRRLV